MTIKINRYPAGSDEWLQARAKNVTATEIANLFKGVGYKSAASLASEKINGSERFNNNFLRIGNMLEPAVLQGFEMYTGIRTMAAESKGYVRMYENSEWNISCTLDGITEDGSPVEAKTVGSADPIRALDNFNKWKDSTPLHYLCQVQTQLMMSETDYGYIVALQYNYPVRLICYKVNADRILQNAIRRAVKYFYDCINNDQEYELKVETIRAVKDRLFKSQEFLFLDEGI